MIDPGSFTRPHTDVKGHRVSFGQHVNYVTSTTRYEQVRLDHQACPPDFSSSRNQDPVLVYEPSNRHSLQIGNDYLSEDSSHQREHR